MLAPLHTALQHCTHCHTLGLLHAAPAAILAHPQQQNDDDDDGDAILSDIHVGSETGDTLYALRYRTAGSATTRTATSTAEDAARRTRARDAAADVGLQVWRGALVVCYRLLAEDAARPGRRDDRGARRRGRRRAASRRRRSHGAVHRHRGAVALAARNAARNAGHRRRAAPSGARSDWRAYADGRDVEAAPGAADVVAAADCIYDDAATTALFDALRRALAARPGRYAVVALEKRFNFEAESLSVVAHGYRTFRGALAGFDAVRLALPPRFVDYDRGDVGALELWRVGWLV